MIKLGITKHYDEYRVFWTENGRDDESKAYYTDDPTDAVSTLIDTFERAQSSRSEGEVTISDARTTTDLISKYRAERFGT